jgi:hypothetical protein
VDADNPGFSPLPASGERLATMIRGSQNRVDMALVHDPAMAPPLSGVVPLVLAGHKHRREVSVLAPPSPAPSPSVATPSPSAGVSELPLETQLMVQGSSGGAGLRGLEKDEPTPLTMSVLYFDEAQDLKAYDDIQLGGTGEQNVTMQRKLVGIDEPEPTTNPSVFNAVTPGMTPSSAPPGR